MALLRNRQSLFLLLGSVTHIFFYFFFFFKVCEQLFQDQLASGQYMLILGGNSWRGKKEKELQAVIVSSVCVRVFLGAS